MCILARSMVIIADIQPGQYMHSLTALLLLCRQSFPFELSTTKQSGRSYLLAAESEASRQEWVTAFAKVNMINWWYVLACCSRIYAALKMGNCATFLWAFLYYYVYRHAGNAEQPVEFSRWQTEWPRQWWQDIHPRQHRLCSYLLCCWL